MKQLLQVREFDTVIGNKALADKYNCKYMDKDAFEELRKYIQEFSSFDGESDVLDFMKVGYRRNVGDTITFKNYVGLIQLRSGYQVEILPKISFGNQKQGNVEITDERKETKKKFVDMLRCMKDFSGKIFTNANLESKEMNLYEVFISMYIQEVWQLVKRGLKSAYVYQEDNCSVFKGRLLVNKHIQNNVVHKEHFYVGFDEYLVDMPENRIVKSTLLKLQKITGSVENSKEIRKLLVFFELVNPSLNYDVDFSKIIFSRNTKGYEMLIKWSKVFLKDKSFTTFSGSESARALLFPMEKIFEAYVAKNMQKVFGKQGWNVLAQVQKHYLFEKLNNDNFNRFKLKPDLLVKRKDKPEVILDTKWKRLINDRSKNYGISPADMYQMFAYSKKYDVPEIWLLYPMSDEMRNDDIRLSFESIDKNDNNTKVTVFFVDVANIEKSMEELFIKLNG